MELFLQFGYGMMAHCRFLTRQWDGAAVILSPRDLSREQLVQLGASVIKAGGVAMLDPQIYRLGATHERLITHDFWPKAGGAFGSVELERCLNELAGLNDEIRCARVILPGFLADAIDDDWLQGQLLVIEEAQRQGILDGEVLHTIALSSDAVRNDAQVESLIEAINSWDGVDGIYLVCEHPNGDYLVSDAGWMANCLDLVAGIRLAGKDCVVAYANHQMLIAAAAGASALCSGTWMNVRTFGIEKFNSNVDEEIKQRSIWYYSPQALSEYKVNFLDLAKKNGLLPMLQPAEPFANEYSRELFSAPQPSLGTFTEQDAFRHYLQSIRIQCLMAAKDTFDETVASLDAGLVNAATTLATLQKGGIRGQQRDFSECVDASRGALEFIRLNRGAVLRRSWPAIIS